MRPDGSSIQIDIIDPLLCILMIGTLSRSIISGDVNVMNFRLSADGKVRSVSHCANLPPTPRGGQAVSFFSAFAASFGSMLLMAALISSWLFRFATAPLVAKIAVPALIVALACATPYQVNAMLGFLGTVRNAARICRTHRLCRAR
jgi:hypothetical protein